MIPKAQSLDIHSQVECAETLASRFYTDPQILNLEKERIFRRTWQLGRFATAQQSTLTAS